MPVTKLFIIGTLTAPSTWISLITAFAVAYSAVRIRFGKTVADILVDAIFYFILVWKLSFVITDFSNVIKSPLSVIYFNGGLTGFYLGLLVAVGKVLFEIKKKPLVGENIAALFAGAVIIQAVYQVMMALLNEGDIVAQIATVTLFTLFTLFMWINITKAGVWPFQLALLFLAVHLFVAAFQPSGLTGTPFIATILLALFFAVSLFEKTAWKLNRRGNCE